METVNKCNQEDIYSLIPQRGYWTGYSSILCLMGEPRKFNYSKNAIDADNKALNSDWATIGRDFINAIKSTLAAAE